MSLLVEYTVLEGKAEAQVEALNTLVDGLKASGARGFSYTAYESDDPTKFYAVLDFDDDEGKQQFLESDAFAAYRDSAKERFPGPPNATPIRKVASTLD